MKKGFRIFPKAYTRGGKGTRTPDPLLAKQMRYQLRHTPNEEISYHTERTATRYL